MGARLRLKAGKDISGYPPEIRRIFQAMKTYGLILADNVTSHDLSAYQAALRARSDVETVTIPIGRGVEFTLKTA